jgi:hypothetical protein
MSWVITSSGGGGKVEYYLLPTSVCRVGRQGCRILIPDTTVSRHHADLETTKNGVVLKDVSKFVQTAVNGKLLTTENRVVVLKDKDVVTFGAFPESFVVEYRPFLLACVSSDSLGEFKNQAESCGVQLTSDVTDPSVKGLIVQGNIEHTNDRIIKALLKGIPLVTQSFLVAMSHCHSGCTALPVIQDNLSPIPNPHVKRQTLFRHKQFLLFGSFSDFDSGIIKLAGGEVIDSVTRSLNDIYIINESNTQPMFDHAISKARLCSLDMVRRAVVEGNLHALEKVPTEDIQPRKPEISATGTGWISTQTKADHACFETSQWKSKVAVDTVEDSSQPIKKFKKSRIVDTADVVVPLRDWGNSTSLRHTREGNVTLKKPRGDDLDEWMNSTISQ